MAEQHIKNMGVLNRPSQILSIFMKPGFQVPTILLFGVLARLPSLFSTYNQAHTPRTVEQAFHVRMWLLEGFDALGPQVPVYGLDSRTPLHFPLVSYLGFAVAQITGEEYLSTRVASLVFYQLGAIALFVLVRNLFSHSAAVGALLVYELTPFGIVWSTSTVPDVATISLALAAAAFLANQRPGVLRWTSSLLLYSAALAVKPTGAVLYAPLLGYLLFSRTMRLRLNGLPREKRRFLDWIIGTTYFVVGLLPLLFWVWKTSPIRGAVQAGLHTNPISDLLYFYGGLLNFSVGRALTAIFHETQYTVGSVLIFAYLFWRFVTKLQPGMHGWVFAIALLVPVLVPSTLMVNYASFHAYFALNAQPAIVVLAVLGLRDIAAGSRKFPLVGHFFYFIAVLVSCAWLAFLVTEGLQRFSLGNTYSGIVGMVVGTVLFVACFLIVQRNSLSVGNSSSKFGLALMGTLGATTTLGWLVYTIAWQSVLDQPLDTKAIKAIAAQTLPNDFIVVFGCRNAIVFFESKTRGLQTSVDSAIDKRLLDSLRLAKYIYVCDSEILPHDINQLLVKEGFVSDTSDKGSWSKQNE